MEEPECCLNLRGYPPGAGPAMIADLFREFKIKKTKAAGGPAIHQR